MFYPLSINNQTKLVADRDCTIHSNCKEIITNFLLSFKDIAAKDVSCNYCTTDNCNNNLNNSSTRDRIGLFYISLALVILSIIS